MNDLKQHVTMINDTGKNAMLFVIVNFRMPKLSWFGIQNGLKKYYDAKI